ncbi:MAG TPA: ATP-binding protein [Thermoanaerobaculia bacterium]|nr:ATP-binding protein [Thermoanaerobaculia bacterium]
MATGDFETQSSGRSSASQGRISTLARIIEAFTRTLDLDDVLRQIVTTTLEEFRADRAWLLSPVDPEAELATVAFEATTPGHEGAFAAGLPVPLAGSRDIVRRAMESGLPVASDPTTDDLDPALVETWEIRSQLAQVLRPAGGEMWAFGMHQCTHQRVWSPEEIELFAEVGRYATIALNNALAHRRATSEAALVDAVLDQIPDAVALYDRNGRLDRLNEVAKRETAMAFLRADSAEEGGLRHLDGRSLSDVELPHRLALGGASVRGDYLTRSVKGDERIVHLIASPAGPAGQIIGSVVLVRDVTDERRNRGEEQKRRSRSAALAALGADLVSGSFSLDNLDTPARTIGEGRHANVLLYLYDRSNDQLELIGSNLTSSSGRKLVELVSRNPYRSGEGLPGTVFQLGRALHFSEIRGDAVISFGRTEQERDAIAALGESSLIAAPMEAWGERIGALVISASAGETALDREDVAFVETVAERIAAAVHIHRLTRLSQEGHRAADELARREVEARSRFEAVLDSAPIGIAVLSSDELRFELANPLFVEYAERFGKVSADSRIEGLRAIDVIPDLEMPLREAAERREPSTEYAIEVSGQARRWYMKRIVSPVVGRLSGQTQSLTVLLQDVTGQVHANNEIEALAKLMEERSARLDSILGSMTDALLVYDSLGSVIDVNPAALALFGLGSRSEAIARGDLRDFLLRHPDGAPVRHEELPHARALRGEVVPDFIVSARQLITERDLDLSIAAAPIESGGIVGAVLVIRDITALQELDRKKDEFLSVASHELRTPLTTIKGYAQLLAHAADLSADDRNSYLDSVLGEVDRMMGLISELLDVSRIETRRLDLHPRPVRWLEFLWTHIASFTVQNPDRELRFDVRIPEIEVEIDPDRMRQVIDNLLSNAVKYSAEGSSIELRVEADDEHLRTLIIDHGIGIPLDELSRLFDRFHRARNVSSRYYGGLGLGLYIAKAIVEAHRGSISVTSDEGEGSTFILSLPLG